VDDAVDHCGGDGWVAEDTTPAAEGQVGGQDERGMLVPIPRVASIRYVAG
jgi:hypothetical protein